MIKVVIIIIIIILVLVLLLLLLPIHYDFRLKKDGELNVVADLNYPLDIIRFHLDYYLLMNFNLKIFGLKVLDKTIDPSYKDKTKEKNKKEDKANKKKKGIVGNALSLSLKDKLKLIANLKNDITLALKKIKSKYDKIALDLGMENQFLLGVVLAALAPIKLLLKDLRVYPHFTERVFKIDMELRSDINLFTLLLIALKFRFSKKYKALFD